MFKWINTLRLDDMVYISSRLSVSWHVVDRIATYSGNELRTENAGTNWFTESQAEGE